MSNGILKKMLTIQQELKVEKTGYDERQDYYYFKADDIANAVRKKMNEVGVISRDEVINPTEDNFWDQNGRNRPRHTATVRITFVDPEDGSEFPSEAYSTGSDTGGDKGTRKLMVQGFKEVAINVFKISEGMDQADSDKDAEQEPINNTPPRENSKTIAELKAIVGKVIRESEIIDSAGTVLTTKAYDGAKINALGLSLSNDDKQWNQSTAHLEAVIDHITKEAKNAASA